MFCSGANILHARVVDHAWKVNFCKFTNETRNGMEDSSRHEGLKVLAAVNGTVAGGGYELALACDEILMIDDRSSTVSLPELPLLGVLPGTGGLTRVTDKRKVRRDLADVFSLPAKACARTGRSSGSSSTIPPSLRHSRTPSPRGLPHSRREARVAPARRGTRLSQAHHDASGYHYEDVDVKIDRKLRTATITVFAPRQQVPSSLEAIHAAATSGGLWRWPRARRRDPHAAHQRSRYRHLDLQHPRRRRQGAGGGRGLEIQRRRLVRPPGDRLPAPHARAPRRLVAPPCSP